MFSTKNIVPRGWWSTPEIAALSRLSEEDGGWRPARPHAENKAVCTIRRDPVSKTKVLCGDILSDRIYKR